MVCWVHQVCGEKFCNFFHHHLHTFMAFQLYKIVTSVSMKASCSSCEFSLKLSLAYSEMDESTILTHVCADFTLSRMACSHKRRRATVKESEMKQIANRFLVASSASYILPNLLAETLQILCHYCGIFPRIFQFFYGINFQRSKSLAGKIFAVY